jgi:hypothetical protein
MMAISIAEPLNTLIQKNILSIPNIRKNVNVIELPVISLS